MFKSYFRIAWRNLVKNKGYSFINIAGLAAGMAVAMLIGLWVWDELSFDKYNRNYSRIAQVMQHQDFNGETGTWQTMPYPMGETLRNTYGSDFKHVVMSSWDFYKILSHGDKQLKKIGKYVEPDGPALMDLHMLKGTRSALHDPTSILLSESTAAAYFGDEDPMGKNMQVNQQENYIVRGVYKNLPYNSAFGNVAFLAPWETYINALGWVKNMENPWGSNAFLVYVQLADHADMDKVSAKISKVKQTYAREDVRKYNSEIFLHPMSRWHLYESFSNGANTGGRVRFVWLFGITGMFVLLLACINFMNLSTARSEKRAREVGIRKAIGSLRTQLVGQFFSESLLVVIFGLLCSLLLVQLALPFFNSVADKKMAILWTNPAFWLISIGISLLTGLIAGSYPAFYLSSFQPVKVLKGTFQAGRYASLPRKVLVVLQFTVSVILITGTLIVFRQIQFARERPAGYSRDGLISLEMNTPDIPSRLNIVSEELKNAGAITGIAGSSAPPTSVWSTYGDISWPGKDPGQAVDIPTTGITHAYGKTMGWQFREGRDFSTAFASDSSALIINEAAVAFMGLKEPIGTTIRWGDKPFTIIGVIKNMIVESPYQPVRPSMYHIGYDLGIINIRINPSYGIAEAIGKIESLFKKYSPDQPFEYQFVDTGYAQKFANEERIGKLASSFAILAIFISCLGLFGMASFMAERRTKEIGIRKVMGASVFNLWRMLSKDFVVLVFISLLIALPVACYLMQNWLQNYAYRSGISWWIPAATSLGVLLITLLTVSFQSIRAALMNPVKSLKVEN